MLILCAGLVLTAHFLVLWSPHLADMSLVQALINLLLPLLVAAARAAQWRRSLMLFCVSIAAFVSATLQAGSVLADRLDASLDGRALEVEGTVASLAHRHARSISFILEDASVADSGVSLPARIKVSWFRSARLPGPGERWRLSLRLRAPRGTLNPGGFDQEAWLFRERIGATASVISSTSNARLGLTGSRRLLRLRGAIAARVEGALAGHAARGMISGLAVGLRHGISPSQWRTLADTGTGHLVAISGLHVGLVAGFVFALVRLGWGRVPWLATRIAPLDAAWPPALLAAFAYALLAGFAMPTRRALLMLGLWFGARALRRPARPASVLSLALIASLAMDALSLLSPGFWLSFGAVATLFLAARLVAQAGRLRLVPLQGLVFTGLAPATFAAFGKLPLAAPLCNLIMIPFFSFLVIPLVLVYLVTVGVWPFAAERLLRLPAGLIAGVWPLLEWFASAETLTWHGPGRSASLLLALLLVALVGLSPRWSGKYALLGTLVLSVTLARPAVPPDGGIEVTVFDVGHGLAILVRTRAHALLYDTGPGAGSVGVAERVIVPALSHAGIGTPDIIVLSHDDANHVSGAAALAGRYPGAAIVSGAPESLRRGLAGAEVSACAAGQAWHWDGVSFIFLQPGREIVWEDNDSSCVLQVAVGGTRLLITGDLTRRGERRLLQRYPELRADVVIGLNHGSDTASSPELASSLGADLVVFSTAWVNPWDLPREEVIGRWREHRAKVLDTGDSGVIGIRAGTPSGGWQVTRIRQDSPRVWRVAPLR